MNYLNKSVKQILKFFIDHVDILIFFVLIEIKVLYFGKLISPEYFNPSLLRAPVIASIIPILALALLFKNKSRIQFLYVVDWIISLILFADIIYFHYFKDVISVVAIRDSVLLGNVTSSIKSLISKKDFIFLLDVILFLPFMRLFKNLKRNQMKLMIRIALASVVLVCGVGMDAKYIIKLNVDQPKLIETMSNKIYLTKLLGDINFHILDAYNVASNDLLKPKNLSTDSKIELKSFITNQGAASGTNFKSAGKDKNLIMIQVEALQQFVIGATINGQEITPNLNRWMRKSMYFDNYSYQVAGGTTSDAEFISNNSLFPAAEGAAYYKYTGDTLNSLPKMLGNEGYYTAALHGYTEGFWNRNVMYNTEGFDDFYGEHSFNIDENVGLGLSDKSFLTQALQKLQSFKQPYYSFIITLSSHFPYDDVKGYGDFNVGQYENTLIGDYFKAIHYTDAQLGVFLDELEKKNITQNSIVVLYGDHYAIPKAYAQQLYQFEGIKNPTDLTWAELQKVPMMIHFPSDQNSGVNHTYSGQIDLYPTLANLFDFPREYTFGKDLLNCTNQNVTFRDGSFTDGTVYYIASTNTYYELKSGNKISETEKLKSEKETAQKELGYSDNILDYNLIKKVK